MKQDFVDLKDIFPVVLFAGELRFPQKFVVRMHGSLRKTLHAKRFVALSLHRCDCHCRLICSVRVNW